MVNTGKGRYLSTGEVALICEVSPITVAKWIDDGILPGHATPGGHRRVTGSNLAMFLRNHGMEVPVELERQGKTRVLAVEDDPDFVYLLDREFQAASERYEYRVVSRGTDALVLVGAWTPDVMLLDIGLPDIDGLEVCRRLATMKEASSLAVVAITAHVDEAVGRQLKEAGALAYVDKADLINGVVPLLEELL